MSFENNIQKWVDLENKIKNLNKETKLLKEQQKTLETQIINTANENNISNSIIKINNIKIRFTNTTIYEALSFKYLEKNLINIINDQNTIKQIINHLKTNRNQKTVKELKII